MNPIKIAMPILFTIGYTTIILFAANRIQNFQPFRVSEIEYINFQFNYQSLLLILAAVSLASTFMLNKENFLNYFSLGSISAPTQEMKIFGIKQNDGWLKTGISLSLIISLVTAIFMYFQLIQVQVNWSLMKNGFLWVLLFSLTNSFGEEMIFRIGVVSPLKGLLSPIAIFIISAVLFGLPHLAGMPSGLIGALMAGYLGLVLAKSVFETNGFFWAWLIHFLQDVIIIGSLFLIRSNNNI